MGKVPGTAAIVAAIALAVLAGAPAALAAEKGHKDDGHKHDEKTHKPHHGGVVSIVGHDEYELVAKPDSMVLYVTSDEKPVSTKGGSASVTLLGAADKAVIKLEPAGENRFEAKGNFKPAGGTKVLANVTLAGKKPTQIRFTLK